MTVFKEGDKVSIGENAIGIDVGTVFTIVESLQVKGVWVDVGRKEVMLKYASKGSINSFADFTLVNKTKFSTGDKVILANPKAASGHELREGWIGYVIDPNDGSDDIPVQVASEKNSNVYYYFDEDELELLSAGKKEERLADYLVDMFSKPDPELEKSVEKLSTLLEAEYTGGSSSYYKVDVTHPTTSDAPYQAECNDVIEALGLTFTEGNIFKAIWRIAADRQGKKKKGNNSVYDAEKVVFFAERLLIQEKSKDKE